MSPTLLSVAAVIQLLFYHPFVDVGYAAMNLTSLHHPALGLLTSMCLSLPPIHLVMDCYQIL